jgi:hypothetical protein
MILTRGKAQKVNEPAEKPDLPAVWKVTASVSLDLVT